MAPALRCPDHLENTSYNPLSKCDDLTTNYYYAELTWREEEEDYDLGRVPSLLKTRA